MIKITFKNVGQGDSIILEFSNNKKPSLGIIDCKRIANGNPTINHLKNLDNKEILFIVLSHPHIDHYSGLLELLEFIEKENYKIKYFIHSAQVTWKYLNWVELNENDKQLLNKIFHKIISLEESGLIESIELAVKNFKLSINPKIELTCISPSDKELREFTRRVDLFENTNELKCSQAANLLSTVFKISRRNSFVLLTSDTERETFVRFNSDSMKKDYFKPKLVLAQVPHHGSEKNHYLKFWENLNYSSQCPAVISAGENAKYNHPSFNVVNDFHKSDYSIYATNNVNGIEELNKVLDIQKKSLILDMDSVLIEEYNIEGDKIFELDDKFSVSTTSS